MYHGSFSYLVATAIIIIFVSAAYLLTILSLDGDRYESYDKNVKVLINTFTILYCLNMSEKVERIGIYTIEPINSTTYFVRIKEAPNLRYTVHLDVSNLDCEALFN